MTVIRHVRLENNVVTNITYMEPEFAIYMLEVENQVWIPAEAGQVGDIWDGTTFTTPPPPPITLAQYRSELNAIIAEQESARRDAFRDLVLSEADPPITTLAAFRADVEGRNIQWNSLLSTPEA